MRKFELTQSQSIIVKAIQQQGSIYVVGGAVRDLLLGKEPKDIDLVTNLEPPDVQALLKKFGFKTIPDQTAWDHGIIRVPDKQSGDIIDIATFREDSDCDGRHAKVVFTKSLHKDLARRDLTINAMAANITPDGVIKGDIIDPFDGQLAIEDKLLLFVGSSPSKRIKEDFLRMVRTCRFTALGEGWYIPEPDKFVIKEYAHEVTQISKERIYSELLKALSYPSPGNFIRSLKDVDLLKYVIPPVYDCIGIEQNEYHGQPGDGLVRAGGKRSYYGRGPWVGEHRRAARSQDSL